MVCRTCLWEPSDGIRFPDALDHSSLAVQLWET